MCVSCQHWIVLMACMVMSATTSAIVEVGLPSVACSTADALTTCAATDGLIRHIVRLVCPRSH